MAIVRVVHRKCRKLKDGRYPIAIRLHSHQLDYVQTLETSYEVRGSISLTNTFGWIYNNIVNPRMATAEVAE